MIKTQLKLAFYRLLQSYAEMDPAILTALLIETF